MTDKKHLASVLFFLFSYYFIPSYGQTSFDQSEYYLLFDKLVGVENTPLLNGIEYAEKYRMINEKTKFFNSPNFLKGSLTYGGQPYYNLEMKYDVFGDDLLMKVANRLGGKTLKLIQNNIDGFSIDGHDFVRIAGKDCNGNFISGFHEVSYQGQFFKLLMKHIKKDLKRKDKTKVYYEFVDVKNSFVLYYEGCYTLIKKKKDITNVFPEFKQEIGDFYNQTKLLQTSNPNSFFSELFKRIETLMLTKNSPVKE